MCFDMLFNTGTSALLGFLYNVSLMESNSLNIPGEKSKIKSVVIKKSVAVQAEYNYTDYGGGGGNFNSYTVLQMKQLTSIVLNVLSDILAEEKSNAFLISN